MPWADPSRGVAAIGKQPSPVRGPGDTGTLDPMELSGAWRAAPANDELRRTFHEPELDDRGWVPVEVPGHWSSHAELSESRAVLHRIGFELDRPAAGRRTWLTFDGIAQQGDVWLDGGYVGDTDGYFVPHHFEITDLLGEGRAHLLAVISAVFEQADVRSAAARLASLWGAN